MKRTMLLFAIMLTAGAAKSQHINFIASWGSYQPWDVPVVVRDVVFYEYGDYDWVHTRRIVTNGRVSFNVMLQHGPRFLEVSMSRFGHIYDVRSYDYYPLHNHVCSASCGYHEYYYQSFHTACRSNHHHGHNHVFYRPRPVNYVWGHYYDYPSYVKVVNKNYYKHYPNKKKVYSQKGNSYKGYKNNNNAKTKSYNKRPDPIVVQKQRPQRRQGTYEELNAERSRKEEAVRRTEASRRVKDADSRRAGASVERSRESSSGVNDAGRRERSEDGRTNRSRRVD